jgi:hypothetical protein
VSKGGFRTRREAEAARVEVLNSVNSGAFVRPDRVTVREFLEDEWLHSQRPPALEESTHRSYTHYVRLHVVPYIGGIPLQNLTPMDLNDCTGGCWTAAGARRPRRCASTLRSSSVG